MIKILANFDLFTVVNSKFLYFLNNVIIHFLIFKFSGKDIYTVVGYILIIESLSIIFESYFQNYFAKEFSKNDKNYLVYLFSSLLILFIPILILSFFLIYILDILFWSEIADKIYKSSNIFFNSIIISFLSILLLNLRSMICILKGMLIGLGKSVTIAKISNYSILLKICLTLIVIILKLDIYYIISVFILSSLFEVTCLILKLKIPFNFKLADSRKFFYESKSFGVKISILSLTNIILLNFDRFLIDFLDVSQIAQYLLIRNICNVIYIVSYSKRDLKFKKINDLMIKNESIELSNEILNYFKYLIRALFPAILYIIFLFEIFLDTFPFINEFLSYEQKNILLIILFSTYLNTLVSPFIIIGILKSYFNKPIYLNLIIIIILSLTYVLFNLDEINIHKVLFLVAIFNLLFFFGNFYLIKSEFNSILSNVNLRNIFYYHLNTKVIFVPLILISMVMLTNFLNIFPLNLVGIFAIFSYSYYNLVKEI